MITGAFCLRAVLTRFVSAVQNRMTGLGISGGKSIHTIWTVGMTDFTGSGVHSSTNFDHGHPPTFTVLSLVIPCHNDFVADRAYTTLLG